MTPIEQTYRIGNFVIGTTEQSVKVRHEGRDLNANVVTATHQPSGAKCYLLHYWARGWNPPTFGQKDMWIVLNSRLHVIGKSVYLDEALEAAQSKV